MKEILASKLDPELPGNKTGIDCSRQKLKGRCLDCPQCRHLEGVQEGKGKKAKPSVCVLYRQTLTSVDALQHFAFASIQKWEWTQSPGVGG